MADLSVLVTAEALRDREFIYGATRYVQSQNALSAGLREGQVKLAETVLGPTLTPLIAAPAESLKIATSGQVDLYGLGAWVKVQDTVQVLLFSGITALPAADSLKMADTVTAAFPSVDLSVLVTAESLKIATSGQVDIYGLGAWVKVQDTVTAQLVGPGGDLSVTVGVETLHLADTDSGFVELLSDEAILLADTVTPSITPEQTSGFDELLHVQDTATPRLTPEQTPVLLDSLKIQDVLTSSITPEFASGFDELLHVQDTVTTSLNPLFTSIVLESGKLADTVTQTLDPLQTTVTFESLKVQDQVLTGGDLNVILTAGESLKLADTATTLLNPLFAVTVSELLHVQDQVLTGGDLNVILTVGESGKLADTSAQTLDPLQTTVTEVTVKTSDSLTAQLDTLLASLAGELLHVQDTVFTGGDLQVTLTEPLKLADTVTTLLNPLQTSGFDELLHIQDQVSTGAGLSVLVPADALKLADLVTAARDLEATVTESLKLADLVSPALWLAISVPNEALALADTSTAFVTPLRAVVTQESLKLSESLVIFGDLLSVTVPAETLHVTDIFFVPAVPEPVWICVVPSVDWTCMIAAQSWVCQVPAVDELVII